VSKLKVTLVRSPIGFEGSQRRTCDALGIGKIQRSRTHDDNPVIRGMIHKIRHLVSVETIETDTPGSSGAGSTGAASIGTVPVVGQTSEDGA
jgi:large subunit ribosomal protein L30